MRYDILYRGPLRSCNYNCSYCPFATCRESDDDLEQDKAALFRFVEWVEQRAKTGGETGIFFTPFGEALVRPWYREAIIKLSNMAHVIKTAVQTNLSCDLDWLEQCCKKTIAIWASCHPDQTEVNRFAEKCRGLHEKKIRISAGVVGVRGNFGAIGRLREELPNDLYLWVNAYKRDANYYRADEVKYLKSIDPLFHYNLAPWPSFGKTCRAGETVFSVRGDGAVTGCHFQENILGNIYEEEPVHFLKKRRCTIPFCRCHIGYVHMHDSGLYEIFGDGVMERVPEHLGSFTTNH